MNLILIYLLILAVTNVFGMFDVVEDYRLPGIGKPSDFILILLNLMVIIKVLTKKTAINNAEKKFVKIVLLILAYVFFLVFYSSVILERESFNYALRSGGIYLYYSSFLFPIFLLNKEKNLYQFINFVRFGGILTGSIAIISNIVGYNVATAAHTSEYGNFVRVYLPGFFNYFVIIFWTIQFITKSNLKIKVHYSEMIISSLGILLFLGRTRIIVLILMLLSVIFYLSSRSANRKKIVFYIAAISAGLLITFSAFNFDILEIYRRFQEGYSNTELGTGTFSLRLYAIGIGYEIFSKTPLLGTGFIHPTSNYYSNLVMITKSYKEYAVTNSADFGLASILFTTGIIGFGLISYFVVSILKYLKKQLSRMIASNNFSIKFTYSLAIFTVVLFVFFVQQFAGNSFGRRMVTLYMLGLSFAVKILSEVNIPEQKIKDK